MHVNGIENIEVTDLELNIKEKLYAIDAFKLVEKNYKNTDIFFIMGADNFINIVKWKNSKDLMEKYKYIILDRKNVNIQSYISKELEDKIYIVKNEEYKFYSSSKFRNILNKENKYDENIIPKEVINYIIENNLYKFQKS